jgi:hypothetical protein
MNTTRTRRRIAAVALAGLAFAACADDDTSGEPSPTAAGATSAAVTSAAATTAASATTEAEPYPTQVDVTVGEYHIEIPSEIPSGFVRVAATNTGAMVHYVLLARIHDGMSYDEWVQAFSRNEFAAEGMIDFYGGPNGVGPGETVAAELNLDPGNYVALCLIPGPDGKSHAAMGMMAPVTVTEGAEAVDLATLDVEATVSVTDGSFTVSPGFDGQGRVLVTNDGTEPHEVVIAQILEGGSFDEFKAAMSVGQPPDFSSHYKVSQGIAVMAPGRSVIAEIDLAAGDYVFVCLAPSMADMLPHSMHGEVQLVHLPT